MFILLPPALIRAARSKRQIAIILSDITTMWDSGLVEIFAS